LATSLVMNGFYDEIYMFIAPMVIGDSKAIPVFQTNEYLKLNESKKLILEEIKQFDSDIMLRYK
jgi:riboflavin biosynthesis pyrimidine reductase